MMRMVGVVAERIAAHAHSRARAHTHPVTVSPASFVPPLLLLLTGLRFPIFDL
jgi:hypothetical protein